MVGKGRSHRKQAEEIAISWVVRLSSSNVSSADRQAFERWLDEDVSHRVDYERAAAIWRRADRIRALKPSGEAVDPDAILRALPGEQRSAAAPTAPWRAAAAAVLLLLLTGVVTWVSFGDTAYATAIGERRTIKIRGFGGIELNTDTRLSVSRFGPPRVRLLRGEALVSARQVKTPITITVGGEEIVSPGGEFGVRLTNDLVRVAVEQGEVDISQRRGFGPSQPARKIAAGWIGEISHDGYVQRLADSREFARVFAWRFGAISLSGETVQEAVDEFNRYNERHIIVTDPNLRQRRIGGYFQIEDIDGFAAGLSRLFGATSVDDGRAIYLSEKRLGTGG